MRRGVSVGTKRNPADTRSEWGSAKPVRRTKSQKAMRPKVRPSSGEGNGPISVRVAAEKLVDSPITRRLSETQRTALEQAILQRPSCAKRSRTSRPSSNSTSRA